MERPPSILDRTDNFGDALDNDVAFESSDSSEAPTPDTAASTTSQKARERAKRDRRKARGVKPRQIRRPFGSAEDAELIGIVAQYGAEWSVTEKKAMKHNWAP